jgi:DNA mismatch repair protein MutL
MMPMGMIRVLDDQLINKIAAGEVVERPASVVKELVENAIDAGATMVTVELTEGGRKRILISDNGSGMDRDDARLSLQRHATSKICKDEDLFNLTSMGFRGEALASIAAVSRLTMMTCRQGASDGVKLVVTGGQEPEIYPWTSAGGTSIIVDDLFYNVPVRLKFLKSAATEYAAVLELMQGLALAWPNIDLTLVHNGREVMRAPRIQEDLAGRSELGHPHNRALELRYGQVFKDQIDFLPLEAACNYGSVKGIISPPGVEKATSQHILMFINGRLVKDKGLRFALLRGYHSHLLSRKFPVAVLDFRLDPSLVDVNVHPSKTEVRLQFASDIQGMLAMAVRESIRRSTATMDSGIAGLSRTQDHVDDVDETRVDVVRSGDATPSSVFSTDSFPSRRGAIGPVRSAFQGEMRSTPQRSGAETLPFQSYHPSKSQSLYARADNSHFRGDDGLFPQQLVSESFAKPIPWSELKWLGTLGQCYLLFACPASGGNKEQLLAVDQHAFHERILYERLIRNQDLLKQRQNLLVPEFIALNTQQVEILKRHQAWLLEHGFKFAILNDESIELQGLPVILKRAQGEDLLQDLIRHLEVLGEHAAPLDLAATLAHEIVSTIACHSAVRAGETMQDDELRQLIAQAQTVDFFHNCPHGRRVLKWWTVDQMGQWFDRT